MKQERLTAKAALIYFALMMPDPQRGELIRRLIDEKQLPELAAEGLSQYTIELLASNGRNFVDGFKASLEYGEDDTIAAETVLMLLDLLLDDRSNSLSRVTRAQLFATLLTLCDALQQAYGNHELSQQLDKAFGLYRLVSEGLPSLSFEPSGQTHYGSYIKADCLKKCDDYSEVSDLEEETTIQASASKLPQFWKGFDGVEKNLLKSLYRQLCDGQLLFTAEQCSEDNFLALFEGVTGYEHQAPRPFCACSSLDYWGVFLSVIYKGNKGFALKDGSKVKRSSGEVSISSLASDVIFDQNGKRAKAKTFDRGSGNKLSADLSQELARQFEEMWKNAQDTNRNAKALNMNLKKR